MDAQSLDLADLVSFLQKTFATDPPIGLVMGRTQIRDAVAGKLACSLLQAEELVDSLVLRGMLRLTDTSGGGPGVWQFNL